MADAGNIYAYDPNGCCMWLLKILKSEDIWQDVCYAVPDYNDREVNYILYTDKCGCSCCLPLEDEIIIHTTPWTLKTFNVCVSWSNVLTKWTEAFWTNWCKTMVRYRTDNTYPTGITDWSLLVEETTLNQYNNGYCKAVSSFSWSCIHVKAFALDENNNILSQLCWASSLWTDKSFWYTWSAQTFTIPPGTYCLQVWWAWWYCSKWWWYSSWCIVLTSAVNAYAYVWWQWWSNTVWWWNGWGSWVSNWQWWWWASDIRIWNTTLCNRVIVAWWAWWRWASNSYPWWWWGWCYWWDWYDNWQRTQWSARSWWGWYQNVWWCAWCTWWNKWTFWQGWSASWYSSWGWGWGWYWWGWAYDNDSDADGRWWGWGSGYVWTSATCSCNPTPSCLSTSYYLCNAVSCMWWCTIPAPWWWTESWHTWHGCIKITKVV